MDAIDTALRLKQIKNQVNGHVLQNMDTDMEIMFFCKICKGSFQNRDAFMEHKKDHLQQNGTVATAENSKDGDESQMAAQKDGADPKDNEAGCSFGNTPPNLNKFLNQ